MERANPNRIHELRLAKQWNQAELAEAVGAHKITISKLERGEMRLTQSWMERLGKALGVSSAELLRDSSLIRTVYVSGKLEEKGALEASDRFSNLGSSSFAEADFQVDYGIKPPNTSFFFFIETDIYRPLLHPGDFVRFTHFPEADIHDFLDRICILELDGEGHYLHGVLERGASEECFDLRVPGGGHHRNLCPKRILVLSLAFGLPDFPSDQFGDFS